MDLGVGPGSFSAEFQVTESFPAVHRSQCPFTRVFARTLVLDVVGQLALNLCIDTRRSAGTLQIEVMTSRPLDRRLGTGIVTARYGAVVIPGAFQYVFSAVIAATFNGARPRIIAFTRFPGAFARHFL